MIYSDKVPLRRPEIFSDRPYTFSKLLKAVTSVSIISTKEIRQYSLVVHGPLGFDYPVLKDTRRPFKLVIVESPSKCQTISKILNSYANEQSLGYDFVLASSMGHVRNIPRTKTKPDQVVAGIDLQEHYSPTYEIIPGKERLVDELKALSCQAQQLLLATDDDREGESMAWHLLQVLNENQECKQPEPFARVRFTEITQKAITEAIKHPEASLRVNLVQAQETRRVLDRLAGFTVSPMLWKKVAPGLSAGRVQSIGMALVVQRERERLEFRESKYWSVKGNFSEFSSSGTTKELQEATLVSINGIELVSGTADFDPKHSDELALSSRDKLHLRAQQAEALLDCIKREGDHWSWTVQAVASIQRKHAPPVPFITSSLQQEANRRLGLSVSDTMRSAQKLYEKGFISYMRTDSTHLSDDARTAIRTEITNDYGGPDKYMAGIGGREIKKSSNVKKRATKSAHEAIRPALQTNGRFMKPKELPFDLGDTCKDIYKLIYQRTVMSCLPPQVSKQTSVSIQGKRKTDSGDETELLFRISGSVVLDPGYTVVYPRQSDSKSPALPSLQEGERMSCSGIQCLSHLTQPPPRYTEASFVQELESLGVGRPSTYAGTVQILRDRAYIGSPVTGGNRRPVIPKELSGPAISAHRAAGGEEFTGSRSACGPMIPSLSAFVVTSLLERHCKMYVDPLFTAKMEERLDKIANSDVEVSRDERVAYLDEFYGGTEGIASRIKYIEEFVDCDEARCANLPSLELDTIAGEERIGLFVGPWGPFVKKLPTSQNSIVTKPVTAILPQGMASDLSSITLKSLNAVLKNKEQNGTVLGTHPADGRAILLKLGPHGAYLQWGKDGEENTTTHTLPREVRSFRTLAVNRGDDRSQDDDSLASLLGVTREIAVQYLSLPRTVCKMKELPIVASIGKYGPYLKYNNTYVSLSPFDGDVLTIDADTAARLVTDGIMNDKKRHGVGVLAEIGEEDGCMVTVKSGRFGPYINWKNINVNLPEKFQNDPSSLPFEEAWTLIKDKSTKGRINKSTKNTKKTKSSDTSSVSKQPGDLDLLFHAERSPPVSRELGGLSKEARQDEKASYLENAAAVSAKTKKTTRESPIIMPKRPRSSYSFYCNAHRPEISKELSSRGEVSKELARRWANLDNALRKEFEAMATADRERYEREAIFKLDEGNTSTSDHMLERKSHIVGNKRRKKSAYMLFCASHRSKIVDSNGKKLSLPETTKILAEMWRKCDDTTRAQFVSLAEAENEAGAT